MSLTPLQTSGLESIDVADSQGAQRPALNVVYCREEFSEIPLPAQVSAYPELRYMGSKRRLLQWIHGVLSRLDFATAADPFVGSGCVAYLLKSMGKQVEASDFLSFPTVFAQATVENDFSVLDRMSVNRLLTTRKSCPNFIEQTFSGVFFTPEDLRFLDRISANIDRLETPHQVALARAALFRSCLKKQPRGVFTISGDLSKYDDGRRDLHISIEQHFLEQIEAFNSTVFDNGKRHRVYQSDVFNLPTKGIDLVYLDPPYVPRSDDNCYIKRYHFLEGLSCYWEGLNIMHNTKVKKISKRFTPFSYRRTAVEAFDRLFHHYKDSIIVLSYSSNGFPSRDELETLMRRYKRHVVTYEKPHRYHFGTHAKVTRAEVHEYLIVGQ